MANWLKWVLGGLGWASGGFIGGLIGYGIGSAISSLFGGESKAMPGGGEAPKARGPYRNTGTQADFDAALMVLVAAVLKADGTVRRSELDYVKLFLRTNYGEERGKELLKLIQQLVEKDIPVGDVCQQIKVNTDYNTRYQMFDFLFGLSAADGEVHASELALLSRIASHLGIARADYLSSYERHVGNGGGQQRQRTAAASSYDKDPYRVLGIDSSSTDDEVRRAYRRMAMKYHPDRVAGMGEELQRNAAEQMKEINRAYEEIKKRRDSLR